MSGKGRCADKRIERTVAYLLRCPRSTVPEAMRACKFSDKESKNAGKQMAVRRAREKAASGKRNPPPSQFNRCVDSWDVDRVPDHRRQLDKITPLDAANNADDSDDAREYALNKIGKQG